MRRDCPPGVESAAALPPAHGPPLAPVTPLLYAIAIILAVVEIVPGRVGAGTG